MLEVHLVSLKPALVRRELRASHYLRNHQIKEKLELSGSQRGCCGPNLWLQPVQTGAKGGGCSPGTRKQAPPGTPAGQCNACCGRLALQKGMHAVPAVTGHEAGRGFGEEMGLRSTEPGRGLAPERLLLQGKHRSHGKVPSSPCFCTTALGSSPLSHPGPPETWS